jgi:hypothetical protein
VMFTSQQMLDASYHLGAARDAALLGYHGARDDREYFAGQVTHHLRKACDALGFILSAPAFPALTAEDDEAYLQAVGDRIRADRRGVL